MEYTACALCAHKCLVDRTRGELGRCRMSSTLRVSRIALHPWEEPPISGKHGSGTVFFVGCSLGCVYCQNRRISRGEGGEAMTPDALADRMLALEAMGAANINLVTPTHFVPSIVETLEIAKRRGLTLPIVYNTASFDSVDTLRALDGLVDIYLPDFKYFHAPLAKKYSFAESYPEVAKAAIAEMVRQRPTLSYRADGTLASGVLCRLLLLPGALANTKLALSYLYRTYGDSILISLMNQYTPVGRQEPPLHRPVTHEEYESLLDYARRLGLTRAFTQEFGTAKESFIPEFS